MAAAHDAAELLEEADVAGKVEELLGACAAAPGVIILVTAEVGLGVVPDHPVARRYCDLLGRCNQIIAAQADSVTLVTCGLPLILKGRDTP
jgi:adenosylcobinamide kinase/adenosylcobinamide-phosphate guanylyltransferase